jgi:signal transduction histidine kinase
MLAEQLALIYRLSFSPLVGSILIGAIIAYLAIDDFGWPVSAAWYIAAMLMMVVRLQAARRFHERAFTSRELVARRRTMLTLIFIFGLIWGIPGIFLMPSDPQKEVVMVVMFIGASATGLGSLSPVRHAYAALLVPFMLPYGLNQFFLGGERMMIGGAVLLYLPVMIVIANRQTDSVEKQIRLAIENEQLAEALRAERDRANEANRELTTHVEQQRRSAERIRLLNSNLESQATELRVANNDLEGFCYSVSHDLRGPLRAIDGFSHLLEERTQPLPPGETGHYMRRIRANIDRMSTLIDDLLAFSRCGRQPIEKSDLHMEELALSAANEARYAHASEVPPRITIEHLPTARGDQHLMMQVWVNLIDNAVKYSSKVSTPTIIVRGREEEGRTIYEVIDNGVGFDSRYRSSLFGVFQRLHGAEYPGTGVGLAIVQRIVTRHGGEVWAQSEVDRGATFGFALPKAEPLASDVQVNAF